MSSTGHEIGAGFVAELEQIDPCGSARLCGPALVTHGSADQSVPVGHGPVLGALPGTDTTEYRARCRSHFSSVAWEREVIGVTRNWLVERLGVA